MATSIIDAVMETTETLQMISLLLLASAPADSTIPLLAQSATYHLVLH